MLTGVLSLYIIYPVFLTITSRLMTFKICLDDLVLSCEFVRTLW